MSKIIDKLIWNIYNEFLPYQINSPASIVLDQNKFQEKEKGHNQHKNLILNWLRWEI